MRSKLYLPSIVDVRELVGKGVWVWHGPGTDATPIGLWGTLIFTLDLMSALCSRSLASETFLVIKHFQLAKSHIYDI